MIDQGEIWSDKLPIFKLNYGGGMTPFSSIAFNLGPFICFGKNGPFPSEQADFERQEIQNKIMSLKRQLNTTQDEMNQLSEKIDDLSTTKAPKTASGPVLIFQKLQPFRAGSNLIIGEINGYYDNYEVSMEFKFDGRTGGWGQLLQGELKKFKH